MADAYACLDSLRAMLVKRREELKEKMANGLEQEDSYRTEVGRCKELKETIAKITQQIRNLTGGTDEI